MMFRVELGKQRDEMVQEGRRIKCSSLVLARGNHPGLTINKHVIALTNNRCTQTSDHFGLNCLDHQDTSPGRFAAMTTSAPALASSHHWNGILDSAGDSVGNTPLINLSRLARHQGVKCNIRESSWLGGWVVDGVRNGWLKADS